MQNTTAFLNENQSAKQNLHDPVPSAPTRVSEVGGGRCSTELRPDNRLRAYRLRTINDYAGPRFIKLTGFQHLPVISISVHVNEADSLTSQGKKRGGDSPHLEAGLFDLRVIFFFETNLRN